jgi:hypothetical protein
MKLNNSTMQEFCDAVREDINSVTKILRVESSPVYTQYSNDRKLHPSLNCMKYEVM